MLLLLLDRWRRRSASSGLRRKRKRDLSVYGLLAALEAWLTGYKVEHLALGVQMTVCFVLAVIPLLVQRVFNSLDSGGSVLYTAITVAVVLEPSTGDSLRKAALRISGAGLAGGLGLLALLCAGQPDPSSAGTYNESANRVGSWVAGALGVLGFALKTNHQRFWRHHEFWGTALFTLPIITVPAIRCAVPDDSRACTYYRSALLRMANVVIGIGFASVISFFVFPVRARGLLRKKMASTLTKTGDFAVWLVGQVCVPAQASSPGGQACLPGATGTDDCSMYADDGLRARLAPLLATAAKLSADVAYMDKLLEAAQAEVYLLKKPHTFPTQQYRNLLDSCHVVMGVFLALLHSLQSGEVTLECCQRHTGDLSEAGVRLSIAFTALASLIQPPKSKGGKKKKTKTRGRQAGGAANGGGAAVDLAAAEVAVAVRGAAPAEASAGRGVPAGDAAAAQQQRAGSDEEDDDDPFAGLDTDGPDPSAPTIALTDSQLLSAQQMARHLSRVMSQPQRPDAAYTAHTAQPVPALAEPRQVGSLLPSLGGSSHNDSSKLGGSGDGKPAELAHLPSSDAPLQEGASEAQRADWVQANLVALVDAIKQLEADAQQERMRDWDGAGVPAFLLVVHACIITTRQAGACLTALDPQRGAAVHAYYRSSRQGGLRRRC